MAKKDAIEVEGVVTDPTAERDVQGGVGQRA